MSEWYEELDYDENPFTLDGPTYGFENLINELDYAVHAGNIVLVQGGEGTGKTKLLREMIRKYGGLRKIAYVDCKDIDEPNIELLLKKRNGIIGRIFDIKPKNMIVLLDNIDQLSDKNCERIKYFYDQNFIRSVIFSSRTANGGLKCSDSVKQRISKTVTMKPLSDYEAVQLVREKVGDLLSDHLIKEVYALSNRNLKTFLSNCEKVSAVALKQKQISPEELQKIISGN